MEALKVPFVGITFKTDRIPREIQVRCQPDRSQFGGRRELRQSQCPWSLLFVKPKFSIFPRLPLFSHKNFIVGNFENDFFIIINAPRSSHFIFAAGWSRIFHAVAVGRRRTLPGTAEAPLTRGGSKSALPERAGYPLRESNRPFDFPTPRVHN